jgi:hypothetical protein
MSRTFFLVCLSGVAAAVGVHAQENEPTQGARILAPFKQGLMQALGEGLAQGPVEAIAACRVEAPAIAAGISRDGVRVGRTSHRLRNPANTGPDWVASILDAYADDPADRAPRTVSLGDDRTGYVEPILLQPLCVTCHGESLAPDVAARIRELYPDDRAVGYRVGDLRGVFWAEFPQAD